MEQQSNNTNKEPKSFYQGRGIALGVAFGLIAGLMMDQIAVGLVLGIAVGTGIDAMFNTRTRKEKGG